MFTSRLDDDDGSVAFLAPDGQPLGTDEVHAARASFEREIQSWLDTQAARINGRIEALLNLHHDTPPPDRRIPLPPAQFDVERPEPPPPLVLDFWARLWPPRRRRLEEAHAPLVEAYRRARTIWERDYRQHQGRQLRIVERHDQSARGDIEAMDGMFGEVLESIAWPHETMVSYDFGREPPTLAIDVEMPAIHDMPTWEARPARRTARLVLRRRGTKRRRRDYARHAHAAGLRILGEAFAALPAIEEITISVHAPRSIASAELAASHCLYSARVRREAWQSIDFTALDALDPVAAFARFELRRELDRHGAFAPITPFEPRQPPAPPPKARVAALDDRSG